MFEKFCEEQKSRPDAFLLAHQLVHQRHGYPDTVRHFGLNLLEHQIRYNWASVNREGVQQVILDLIGNGGLRPTAEPRFIMEKAAHLVAELAERQWPSEWPGFNAWLTGLFLQSHPSASVSIVRLLCAWADS